MTETRLIPADLPLFPLAGVVLLPGETLHLNVFEPRYLNMIDDVRRSGGFLGIIQTRPGGSFERPGLAPIGCVGEITAFEETADGRYLIALHGLTRFALGAELGAIKPYRVASADYAGFKEDLRDHHEPHVDREAFLHLLLTWLQTEGLSIDRTSLEAAPISTLVNQLTMKGPFSGGERQVLLTAQTIESRLELIEDIIAARLAASASGPLH
ncbi:LON peptidase substrate-binding domain-containing protein [Maricaulis sp.]|uniref:LON peptidase substrate-binding domain-containing protein n=1 Tax=Maricaulis sp. TaxID=1486257 RepID=UPI001B01FFA7|nr:LON peptidase substrate-binding domain-containing protein [Maricaulis sp.]MBO6797514.1 LON peptidase substrate-binding domain-containing protein [Maricaulis sp.]